MKMHTLQPPHSFIRMLRPAVRGLAVAMLLYGSVSAQTLGKDAGSMSGIVLARQVLSSGAVSAAGTLFQIQGSVGQVAIGVAHNASEMASQGFWFSAKSTAPADASGPEQAPERFAIGNYPNPFVSSTAVRYALREAAAVRVSVSDACGREVRVLAEGALPAGAHSATWDGTDNEGRLLGSGYYICTIRSTGTSGATPASGASIKAILVR